MRRWQLRKVGCRGTYGARLENRATHPARNLILICALFDCYLPGDLIGRYSQACAEQLSRSDTNSRLSCGISIQGVCSDSFGASGRPAVEGHSRSVRREIGRDTQRFRGWILPRQYRTVGRLNSNVLLNN